MAGGIGCRKGVRGGFGRGDVEAAGVGWPNRIGLRLERDGFGVGDAVAKLNGLAAVNLARSGVETLNGEILAAHLLERGAILFALLGGAGFPGTIFDGAVLPPAGKENPANNEDGDDQDAPGIERGVLEEGS